jgi:4-amino-4-deoxy-L-arabinose transferase-like glycosyltransferase
MKKVIDWIEKNQVEFLLLLLILLLASFLRFYRIAEYMTFLGDEGRDALAVKRIIVDHKFRLIGPVTSIGNMYLGPLYYYLMLPPMFIFRLSPVGPAAMVAFLGVVTVGLIWWFGREWVGGKAGLVAAFLYAISPVVITYSRSSWNPNVMPFFALLTIYSIWRVWQKNQFWWLPIIGVTLSFALQSHYLGVLLIPTIGFFWILAAKKQTGQKTLKKFLLMTLLCCLLFVVLTIVPLVWFDLRHNFINFNAFKAFFTDRQETVNLKIYKAIPKLWELIVQVFTRLVAGKDEFWGKWIAGASVGLVVLFTLLPHRNRAGWRKFFSQEKGLLLILTWFLIGLVGLGNYKQHIYDHYFSFFFPVPFLLTGWVLTKIWDYKKFGKFIAALGLIFLVYLSVKESPLRYPPNNQLTRTQKVARFIIEKSQGKPFNLALIAERNYDDSYAYFMEIWGKPPVRIEPLRAKETITEQLLVICEQIPCQPINHPKAEIAMFGWAKIEDKWTLEGVEVYRLVHTQ